MRDLTSPQQAAVISPVVLPFSAVEMNYPDGPVRVTSLDRNITLTSHITNEPATFFGIGLMGAISDIQDGSENKSYGASLTLSGIPDSFAQYLREQDPHGRPVWIMMGVVDPAYNVLMVHQIARMNMDTQDVAIAEQLGVTVQCESAAVDWERSRVRRCTDADHRARYPNDGFFKFVAALENANFSWGRA